MEYDDSFESDDDAAGAVPTNTAASLGQTPALVDEDEYESDTFEQASSDDEYADETFDPPLAPQLDPSANSSHVDVHLSTFPCTDTAGGQGDDVVVKTSPCDITPEMEDSPPRINLEAHAFVAAKLQRLSTQRRTNDDVPPSLSIRVPVCLLHTFQQQPASNIPDCSRLPRRRQRSTTSTMPVPAGVVDRVRIQTLLSNMQHAASSAVPRHHPHAETPPRSLFGFIARHHSRLHDRLWAMQIDALEARQRQSHDTLGWIADHMRRHREAYGPV